MGRRALKAVIRELLRRNGVTQGIVYMQVTRGVARRDHPFPKMSVPALVMTASRKPPPDLSVLETGRKAVPMPDIRWGRCDIKTVGLLPHVHAKPPAPTAGAYQATLVARQAES